MCISRLHSFLELCSHLTHDMRRDAARDRACARADAVRRLLPAVIQSLREALRRSSPSAIDGGSRGFFFGVVREAVRDLVLVFEEEANKVQESCCCYSRCFCITAVVFLVAC